MAWQELCGYLPVHSGNIQCKTVQGAHGNMYFGEEMLSVCQVAEIPDPRKGKHLA